MDEKNGLCPLRYRLGVLKFHIVHYLVANRLAAMLRDTMLFDGDNPELWKYCVCMVLQSASTCKVVKVLLLSEADRERA